MGLIETWKRFKPYKGISSNVSKSQMVRSFMTVSNPIREYLQIHSRKVKQRFRDVSNPIREYLQIVLLLVYLQGNPRFKPYKGISSNSSPFSSLVIHPFCFKPYKGISSNVLIPKYTETDGCFKPYKGISSNELRECLKEVYPSFKPYKGISSNQKYYGNS